MFWNKTIESEPSTTCRKIVLERTNLFGKRRRLKFKEITFPPTNGEASEEVLNITRCRLFWRFRFKHPLVTEFYRKIARDQWEKFGTTVL